MSDLSVVKFPISVPLNDIPGRLRRMADNFEKDPVSLPRTFLWVNYMEDGELIVGAFGDNPSKAELVGILTLAAGEFDASPSGTVRST